MTTEMKQRVLERYNFYIDQVNKGVYKEEEHKINSDPVTWMLLKIIKDPKMYDLHWDDIVDEVILLIMGEETTKDEGNHSN